MSILCGVLHHRSMNELPDYPILENIAILTDKYDFSAAMSLWGRIAIGNHLRSKASAPEMGRVLYPTYVLDNGHAFQKLTSFMVYDFEGRANPLNGPFVNGIPLEIRDMLPTSIFGKSALGGHEI